MFDASPIFTAKEAFDLRRISKIIAGGTGVVAALTPLIAYEDNHLLVIFKPAGWLSQSDETGDPSVNEIFAAYLREKYAKPGNVFCAAVQRLDRPAMGLMVLARTSKAAARLSEEIRLRRFEKRYRVLTSQPLPGLAHAGARAVLVADMQKIDRLAQKAGARPKPGSKTAQYMLSARLVHRGKSSYAYEVSIETGKFHQVRALMAAHGCPLLGDVKYGGKRVNGSGHSVELAAGYLRFMHPTLKKPQLHYLDEASLTAFEAYFI
ncbi:MAG: RNA pseudouridine synthase [Spirochaetes bacterium]|nr:RNA pseudouridine synthase [Spirochaetota bacterium]